MNYVKQLYYWSTGYSYTNMGRLFLRLFVGLMLLQFGVRQWMHYDETLQTFPSVLALTPEVGLCLLIAVEMVCSLFIMFGFLTRIMTVPPFVAMAVAQWYLLHSAEMPPYDLSWQHQGYLPIMFLGIYFFILLVGPGKISVDYFLSLHLIHTDNASEGELEEV